MIDEQFPQIGDMVIATVTINSVLVHRPAIVVHIPVADTLGSVEANVFYDTANDSSAALVTRHLTKDFTRQTSNSWSPRAISHQPANISAGTDAQ